MDVSSVFFFLLRLFGQGWGLAADGDRRKHCHALLALVWLFLLVLLWSLDFFLYLTFFRERVQDMDFSALTIGIQRCYIVAEAIAMLLIAKLIGNQPLRLLDDIRRLCFLPVEDAIPDAGNGPRKNSLLRRQRYTWQFWGGVLIFWSIAASLLLGGLQCYFFINFLASTMMKDNWNWYRVVDVGLVTLPVYVGTVVFFLLAAVNTILDMLLQMLGVWCALAISAAFRQVYKDLKALSKAIDAHALPGEAAAMERVEALSARHLALSQLVNRTDAAFSGVNLLVCLRDFVGFVTGCAALLRADEDVTGVNARFDANARDIALGVDFLARTTCGAYLAVSMVNCVLRMSAFIRLTETGKSALRPLSLIFEQVTTLEAKTSMILILNRIRGHSLTLTGGGLFSLDRSFVVTMFGSFFSFFILVYQMQDQKKDIYSVITQDDVHGLAAQVANITRHILTSPAT
ncbi:uncharacterized protein LOC129596373 [Paramacrobiotus metropolitanus]|uniref:uncharacterized protein LOC129596373 n=1 Tax=Paramacrobiotus metropolitanus TaxID=2943436 RepID=UPI0024464365|nr:uncharacterized protein LOC129596373 [Paramacrobiotus metropolitanus]